MVIPEIKNGDDARLRLGSMLVALNTSYTLIGMSNPTQNVMFHPMKEMLDGTRSEIETVYSTIQPGTLTAKQRTAVKNALVRGIATVQEVAKNGFKKPPGWDDFVEELKKSAKEVGKTVGETVGAAAAAVGETAGGIGAGLFKGLGVWALVLIAVLAFVVYLKLS